MPWRKLKIRFFIWGTNAHKSIVLIQIIVWWECWAKSECESLWEKKNKRNPLSKILQINFSKIFQTHLKCLKAANYQLVMSIEGLLESLLRSNKASTVITLKNCYGCYWLLPQNVCDIRLSTCYPYFPLFLQMSYSPALAKDWADLSDLSSDLTLPWS